VTTRRLNQRLPPETLDGGKVVCFAELDARVRRTGNTVHMLAGGTFEAFRRLVIIEDQPDGPYYLLYCDDNWRSLTDTWHQTLEEAKAQAEFEYEGVGKVWKSRLRRASRNAGSAG
jgi:hypothetical protein